MRDSLQACPPRRGTPAPGGWCSGWRLPFALVGDVAEGDVQEVDHADQQLLAAHRQALPSQARARGSRHPHEGLAVLLVAARAGSSRAPVSSSQRLRGHQLVDDVATGERGEEAREHRRPVGEVRLHGQRGTRASAPGPRCGEKVSSRSRCARTARRRSAGLPGSGRGRRARMRCTSSQLATTVSEPAGFPFRKRGEPREHLREPLAVGLAVLRGHQESARVRARSKKFFSALNLM